MAEPLSQSDIELRDALIRIFNAEAQQVSDLTYAVNKMTDRRYDHWKDMECQLQEAETKAAAIKSRIVSEKRFGCVFQPGEDNSR